MISIAQNLCFLLSRVLNPSFGGSCRKEKVGHQSPPSQASKDLLQCLSWQISQFLSAASEYKKLILSQVSQCCKYQTALKMNQIILIVAFFGSAV